ncbi:MAG: DUF1385 domain-containing protein [Coriobacteriia bacterium]|nr:DUF1385 domain-containing protein [Coriobacteriia bacterium]
MPESKSDLSRAFSEDGTLKTHVGGQALLEGIMMRGKLNWSCAVRQPDGNIYLEEHDLASGKKKNGWLHKPLIRGCTAMVEALGLGFKALEVAANHAFNNEDYSYSIYLEEAEEALEKGEQLDDAHERVWKIQNGELPCTLVRGEGEAPEGDVSPTGETAAAQALEPAGVPDSAVEPAPGDQSASKTFSWKDDFGNPEEMVDALGAQRTLEVVTQPDVSGLDVPVAPAQEGPQENEGGFGKVEMTVSMILGVILALVLFMVAPAAITNLLVGEYDSNPIAWNILDGVLRVGIFILYMWLIGRMKEMKRMFGYHGAEHKAIHCYEHGLPMTPENARRFPRLHVRCGTAFLIMVLIIAILVYTIIPVNLLIDALGVPDGLPKLVLVIVVRIVFLPVIAGVSYEITVKWAGSHPDNALVKVILWPGMQMQYLTTNEPDDGQIECAIEAMKLVLQREQAAGINSQEGCCTAE